MQRVVLLHPSSRGPGSILSSGYCTVELYMFSQWTGYFKLALGVNVCVDWHFVQDDLPLLLYTDQACPKMGQI